MSYYEIVCIIHPALQAGHLEDTIKQINDKINSSKNGKMIYQENWGKKKLSYLIQKQKYGTYYIFQCMIDGQFINGLSDDFQHNTNIIRYLITKVDETQLMKEKKINTDDGVAEKNKDKDENKATLDENDNAEAKIADEKNADNSDTEEKNVDIKDDDAKDDNVESNESDSDENHQDDSKSSEKE